eukprot:jgi/Chrpa1/25631/Chrysochromulina_OHIO_Genome00009475-RA
MLASVGCATERDDGENLIHSAEVDMSKLNEYLQADKENEINVESLARLEHRYADLQSRFNAVKREWQRADVERQAMRRALTEARKNVETVSTQNRRMSSLLKAVRLEQQRLSKAKETVMQALAMDESLDLSDNDTLTST